MYPLMAALTVFSSWALLKTIHDPAKRWWIMYGLTALMLVYTQHFGLFTVEAHFVFAAGYLLIRHDMPAGEIRRDRLTWRLAGGFVIVAAGWLPWLPVILRQHKQVQDDYWSGAFSWSDFFGAWLRTLFDSGLPGVDDLWVWIVGVGSALVLLGLLWKGSSGDCFLVSAVVIPLLLAVTISLSGRNAITARFLTSVSVIFMVCVAALVGRISSPVLKNALALWIVLNMAATTVASFAKLNVADCPGARAAAEYLVAHRHAGEPVVVASPLLYLPVLFYMDDAEGVSVYQGGDAFVHYAGGPLIENREIVRAADLKKMTSPVAWVVSSTSSWEGGELKFHRLGRLLIAMSFGKCMDFMEIIRLSNMK